MYIFMASLQKDCISFLKFQRMLSQTSRWLVHSGERAPALNCDMMVTALDRIHVVAEIDEGLIKDRSLNGNSRAQEQARQLVI